MFSDDSLMEQLVLKGGNALRVAYGIGNRASLDFDFSLPSDFADPDDAKRRILGSLRDRFDSAGYVLFDEVFEEIPLWRDDGESSKGYSIRFKLIEKERYGRLKGDLPAMQRSAQTVDEGTQQRTFTIEISKDEYCGDKRRVSLDDYSIYVYSPTMIAIEKLRAICQQMPEYTLRKYKTSRARDFYDIRTLIEVLGVNLSAPESLELFKRIFAAKEVPLRLLRRIPDYRAFHEAGWAYVVSSAEKAPAPFDSYFDFVIHEIERLEPLWME